MTDSTPQPVAEARCTCGHERNEHRSTREKVTYCGACDDPDERLAYIHEFTPEEPIQPVTGPPTIRTQVEELHLCTCDEDGYGPYNRPSPQCPRHSIAEIDAIVALITEQRRDAVENYKRVLADEVSDAPTPPSSEQQVCGATVPIEFDKWQSVEVRTDGSRIVCGAPIRLRSGPRCQYTDEAGGCSQGPLPLGDKHSRIRQDGSTFGHHGYDPGGYEHYEVIEGRQVVPVDAPVRFTRPVDLDHAAIPAEVEG